MPSCHRGKGWLSSDPQSLDISIERGAERKKNVCEVYSWSCNTRPEHLFHKTIKELVNIGKRADKGNTFFCIQEGKQWQQKDGTKPHGMTYLNADGREAGIFAPAKLANTIPDKKAVVGGIDWESKRKKQSSPQPIL